MEAETALSESVSELKFAKELLDTFKIKLIEPIDIYEDNSYVINIANNGSDENVADILTKAYVKFILM